MSATASPQKSRGLTAADLSLCCSRPVYSPGCSAPAIRPVSCAVARARIGLSTNSASATTSRFMIAVITNTMCHEPVAFLTMLATGTRNAEAPLAV